jgi:hypothetical protein
LGQDRAKSNPVIPKARAPETLNILTKKIILLEKPKPSLKNANLT